jgi:hypothetical protein
MVLLAGQTSTGCSSCNPAVGIHAVDAVRDDTVRMVIISFSHAIDSVEAFWALRAV